MPTLEELRARFRPAVHEDEDAAVSPTPRHERPRYKLNNLGDDAMLFFGIHRGRTLKYIAKADVTYLSWMLREKFPDELKEVVRLVLRGEKFLVVETAEIGRRPEESSDDDKSR